MMQYPEDEGGVSERKEREEKNQIHINVKKTLESKRVRERERRSRREREETRGRRGSEDEEREKRRERERKKGERGERGRNLSRWQR
jgi:hypothetical protein